MKTLFTTLALVTVSVVTTNVVSAQVIEDEHGNVVVGSGYNGGLWLPDDWSTLSPVSSEQNENEWISAVEEELNQLNASLDRLETELSILLRLAPSRKHFRTERDYLAASNNWLDEVDLLKNEIAGVNRKIEYWEYLLEMHSFLINF